MNNMIDYQYDGANYCIEEDTGYVHRYLRNGSVGPIVGKRQNGDSIELDPLTFAGEFANELIDGFPLKEFDDQSIAGLLTITPQQRQTLQREKILVLENAIDEAIVAKIRQQVIENDKRLTRRNHGQDPSIRSDRIRFFALHKDDQQTKQLEDDDDDDEEEEEEEEEINHVQDDQIVYGFKILQHAAFQAVQPDELDQLFIPPQGMVAVYPGQQSFYTKHYDNDIDADTGLWRNYRGLTAIMYLQEKDWTAENGGQLSYREIGEGEERQVLPNGGTIILFDSTKILHQVLPANRYRYALTFWFATTALLKHAQSPRGPYFIKDTTKASPAAKKPKLVDTTKKQPKTSDEQKPPQVWTKALNEDEETTGSSFSFSFNV